MAKKKKNRWKARTSKERFRIAYDGEAVREGVIDAKDLASALLAIGDLCERANFILNGEEVSVSIQVRAEFQSGSFEILLELWQNIPDAVRTAFLDEIIVNAREILIYLGLIGISLDTPAIKSLLAVLKWLKGGVPKISKGKAGQKIFMIGKNSITVHNKTYLLYDDPFVRRGLEKIVEPLKKPGIDRLEFREDQKVVEQLTKEDTEYLKLPEEPEEITKESETERTVEIVSAQFREDLKWRFINGNKVTFTATMEDQDFLDRLDRHEVSFRKGDILDIRLKTRDYLTPEGNLKAEYAIIKVLKHRSTPLQGNMFSEEENPKENE